MSIKYLDAFIFTMAIFSFFTGMYLYLSRSATSSEPLWITLVISLWYLIFVRNWDRRE